MPTSLELSIFRTLAYFAYFRYPLTSFEIWKWLLEPEAETPLAKIVETLNNSEWLKHKLHRQHGFYALEPVADWIRDRHSRFLDAARKYKKVEQALRVYGRLPWVEGVAVCNSLAWHQTKDTSDIDLFVIARPGRLWSVRLLTTIPAILTRQRPGEGKADPVCLSFFVSSEALNLEPLKIGPSDPYLAYWSYSIVPVHDTNNWLQIFTAQNGWLKKYLPNAYGVQRAHRFRPRSRWRWPLPPVLEGIAKRLQHRRFPKRIRELMNRDTRVVVSDQVLKFHDDDDRLQIYAALQGRLTKV